ncbi:MAG: ATPase [Alphaproteobacteria bacterium HGW-Alphaproteobacteria-18]|nr:MAG: ATPase [Alphaproteobacteria bacterium HGW-Alphaproteobacteria-18]
MPALSNTYFVLTGGPGSGKTTLLECLRAQGMSVMPEAGRAIIQAQSAIDGPAVPWGDRALYAELMLSWELRAYAAAAGLPGPILFDRGLPDIVGYLTLEGLAVPAHIRRAARDYRYNATVFIAPPWREIFHQDAERRQDFKTAELTYEAMLRVYTGLGYRMLELPRAPIQDRADFVSAHITALMGA